MPREGRARHFLFKHPLFKAKRTEKGIWFEDSVYYLWVEHLKRNAEYRKYHETKEGTEAVAQIYEDFGDIYFYSNDGFKTWWRDRGQDLFCEDLDLDRVRQIETQSDLNDSSLVLNLAIPITKNVEWLETQIAKQIRAKRKKEGVTGRGAPPSTAKYKVVMKNPNVSALKKGLLVWDEWKRRGEEGYLAANSSYLRVGEKVGLFKEGFRTTRRTNASRTQMVYRLKNQTQQLIDNTTTPQKVDGVLQPGVFPKHSVRK